MYKRYVRLDNLILPASTRKKDQLRQLIINRKSYRNFSAKPINLETLSEILYYSAGITHVSPNESKKLLRAYPSAGSKYPLELYLLVQFSSDIAPGLYHYDPSTHALDVLLVPVLPDETKKIWMSQQWFKKAAVIIFITAVYNRTTDKYGRAGLPFPFIEAGHIVQNMYLIAQVLGVGCCAIGQFNEKELAKLLDIYLTEEFPVYYVALGN